MAYVASIVLFAADLERTADFYRLLGIPLERERHDDGPVHAASEVGGVHFAVHQAGPAGQAQPAGVPGFRATGSTFTGFYVDSLDDTVAALTGWGAPVLTAHEVRPWGCRAVVTDPDGRAVEVNQREHCP